jgi:colanic acid/amylovoran biosynthesis glycosyltransferase
MPDSLTIGYLTSYYARASDSFIRGEVRQLRALGHTVHTFSSRRSDEGERVSDEIRREQDRTEYLLEAGEIRLVLAGMRAALHSPHRLLKAIALAAQIGTPGLRGRLRPFAYLLEAAYLAERLRAKGVQHLHNHIGESSAAVAMLVQELSGIPYSLTIHGPGEFDQPTLFALGEKIRRAAFVAAVSEFSRSQLFRWCDYQDWSKIQIVRCGVDGTFLEQEHVPIDPSSRRLVCVGRLAEQKGQLLLVKAAAQLAAEGLDFEILLAGDGPLRPVIEEQIEHHGLTSQMRIGGWMSTEQVRAAILGSRALVLPSFAEGLPVVLMEALALGRPVVSTFVAGIPELVEPGVNGWLVPAGSVAALAEALRAVLALPVERLEVMGRAGAARVAEQHDARTEAVKLAELFEAHAAGAKAADPRASLNGRARGPLIATEA